MILDSIIDEPRLFHDGGPLIAYVLGAIIIVLCVLITIKLVNKKKGDK
jgi:hypothetical protein